MVQPRTFEGWHELKLEDLVQAYRKAKADAFFERTPGAAMRFALYETNLFENLERFLAAIQNRTRFCDGSLIDKEKECVDEWGDSPKNLFGEIVFFPNKTTLSIKSDNVAAAMLLTTDPDKQEHHITSLYELTPSFRVSSLFPVETHVISALWVNMIGHKLDAKLDSCAYGSRLRRLRGDGDLPDGDRPYHVTATGIFAPYWQHYRKWRDEGLKAIRRLLESSQPVVAYNFDLRSYYHNIDPGFLLDSRFIEEHFEIVFDDHEVEFNKEIVEFILNWQKYVKEKIDHIMSKKSNPSYGKSASKRKSHKDLKSDCDIFPTGIPIGLAATRLMANVLLGPWDRYVEDNVRPEFYGRYVDDMIIVVRGNKRIRDAKTAVRCLRKSLGNVLASEEDDATKGVKPPSNPPVHDSDKIWRIRLDRIPGLKDPCPDETKKVRDRDSQDGNGENETRASRRWVENTRLILQPGKQRIFILEGKAGEDMLNVIEQEIAQLSSEFRLMPSVEELSRTKAARLLVSAGQGGEQADRLGHVNTTTVRRLGWALTLRKAEMIAHDLPASEWRKVRHQFYAFSRHHVLRADRFFDFFAYFPRLIGLAVRLGDWDALEQMIKQVARAFILLRDHAAEIEVNGKSFKLKRGKRDHLDIDRLLENTKCLTEISIIETILRNSYAYCARSLTPENKAKPNDQDIVWLCNKMSRIIEIIRSHGDRAILGHDLGSLKEIIRDNVKSCYSDYIMCILKSDLSAISLSDAIIVGEIHAESLFICEKNEKRLSNSEKTDVRRYTPCCGNDLIFALNDELVEIFRKIGVDLQLVARFVKMVLNERSKASVSIRYTGTEAQRQESPPIGIPTGILFPTRPFKAGEVAEILMRHYFGTLGVPSAAQSGIGGEDPALAPGTPNSEARGTRANGSVEGSSQSSMRTPREDGGPSRRKEKGDCSLKMWGDYVHALRGTWIRPPDRQGEMVSRLGHSLLYVPVGTRFRQKVTLGLTNVSTSEKAWKCAASGKPLLTARRYEKIARVVNDALRCDPQPDYLLFHELCLPRKWVRTVRKLLSIRRISLIAGVEYDIFPKKPGTASGRVANEVHLALIDDRLGYDVCLPLWHSKHEPALEEKRKLDQHFGLEWQPHIGHRVVYDHDGFFFTVLICSELLNSRDRTLFQGAIDALVVPSWNQDLATFSALVKSAALDIHCYVALVNNRAYGDSRVRVPAKARHKRDLARLRGGINDYLVCVELDIDKLRRFQSRARRSAEEKDPFKPVPEGFEIVHLRRKLPPV